MPVHGQLTRIGREFVDPQLERAFRAAGHDEAVDTARACALLYLTLATPFLVYVTLTDGGTLWAMLGHAARGLLLLGATYIAFAPPIRRDARHADAALALFGVALLLHSAAASVQPDTSHTFALLVFSLALVMSWIVVLTRVRLQLMVAGVATVGLILLQALAPPERSAGVLELVFISLANVVGYVARRRLNEATRERYLAHERAARRAERFKALSSEVPVAVLVLDRGRCVVWANSHACAFYHRPLEALEGMVVGQLLNGSTLVIGQALQVDLQPADTLHACRVRATPLPPGEDGWEILVVIQDVTADTIEYRREARTDPLTHLLNRRGFEEQATRALGRAHRLGQPVGLLFADLDHFKVVNDTYGHPVGDAALEVVADSLRQAIRPADPGGRYGGEEFVVLLPNATLDEAVQVGERLRAAVAANPLALVDGRSAHLTISIGATLVDTNEGLADAIERGDKAMLLAKREGRNRVVALPPQAF